MKAINFYVFACIFASLWRGHTSFTSKKRMIPASVDQKDKKGDAEVPVPFE